MQYVTVSIGKSPSQQHVLIDPPDSANKKQARLHSVIPLISVALFISNFQRFVHSAIHVSTSGKAGMVKSIFISAAGT